MTRVALDGTVPNGRCVVEVIGVRMLLQVPSGFSVRSAKTLLLALVVLVFVVANIPTTASAQHSGFGLGFLLGEPSGVNAKLWRMPLASHEDQ